MEVPKLKLQTDGTSEGSRPTKRQISKTLWDTMLGLELPLLLELCGGNKINEQICNNPDFWVQKYRDEYGVTIPASEQARALYCSRYFNNLDIVAWDLRLEYNNDSDFMRLEKLRVQISTQLDQNLQASIAELKKIRASLPPELTTTFTRKFEHSLSGSETMEEIGDFLRIVVNSPYKVQLQNSPVGQSLSLLDKYYTTYEIKSKELGEISYVQNDIRHQYEYLADKLRDKNTHLRQIADVPRTYRALTAKAPGKNVNPSDIDTLLPNLKRITPGYEPRNLDLFIVTLASGTKVFALILDNAIVELTEDINVIADTLSQLTGEKFTVKKIKIKYGLK